MRKKLKEKGADKRYEFVGTFERFGIKDGYKGPLKTVLLIDVYHEGELVCDHLWLNYTKGFAALNLENGDKVKFCARCARYLKGYMGRREDVYNPVRVDWKLSYPTKIEKVI